MVYIRCTFVHIQRMNNQKTATEIGDHTRPKRAGGKLNWYINVSSNLLGMYHTSLVKHSGPYLLSLEDWFNLWYRPIFETRRSRFHDGLLNAAFYPSGVDVVFHIFLSTFKPRSNCCLQSCRGTFAIYKGSPSHARDSVSAVSTLSMLLGCCLDVERRQASSTPIAFLKACL